MSSSEQETLRLPERGGAAPGLLRLVVLGDGVSSTHALPPRGDVVIGRAEDVDIRIDDRSISRRHAVLRMGPAVRLEDLGSANGTRVRERKLEVNVPVPVAPGELIELGNCLVVLQREVASGGKWELVPHGQFLACVEDECRSPQNRFAVIRLQVRGGPSAGSIQEALAPVLRPGDRVGTYGPGAYEVLALGLGSDEAEALRATLEQRLAGEGAQVVSGVARHPEDGRTADDLLAACSRRPDAPPGVVVRDDAMRELHLLVDRLASSSINVLLLGETGVGKEVLAGEIHRRSKRTDKPFLRLNCAALSESLLESELFGHEKGAFTGAVRSKPGLLETAAGGTVLLDEVGEIPPAIQAKLLRVLEVRQVMRVGGLKSEPIDVRFIFATNRDLEAEVARGAFRQDLYYRVNGISVVIPPLRERVGEIEPLAREFIAQAAQKEGRLPAPELSRAAVEELERYPWPGNIRELRNVMERALILCSGGVIGSEHLSIGRNRPTFNATGIPPTAVTAPPAAEGPPNLREERDAAERRAILDALEKCGNNQTQAAKLLGVSRRTLVSRLQEYGLTRPRKPKDPER